MIIKGHIFLETIDNSLVFFQGSLFVSCLLLKVIMCSFIAAYPGPVVINVRTDETLKGSEFSGSASNSQQAIAMVLAGRENGFRLTYTQNTNCFHRPN